jgi:hypothetical protein
LAASARRRTAANPKTRCTVTPQPFQNLMMLAPPKRMVDGMIAGQPGLKKS